MKLKYLLLAVFSLFTVVFYGCGESGSSGLNGAITVDAVATGSVVTATATYTNPTQTNLIGVPIAFSVEIGGQVFSLGTHSTNNSGSVALTFEAPAFSGNETITVTARTGNLVNFDSFQMTGSSLSVAAPAVTLSATSAQAGGSAFPFTIPTALITLIDPFSDNLGNRPLAITASYVSSNPSDTLTLDSPTVTTSANGTAEFSGAHGTLIVPATIGGVETMTITWRVTDLSTGVTGTGTTTVTLTKTS